MTVVLERLADGSVSDRNFSRLALLVPDTLGISLTVRAVAGGITNAGLVNYGAGFSASRSGAGIYVVTYTAPFPAQPVVQFGSDNGTPLVIYFSASDATGFTANIVNLAGSHVDAFINFTSRYLA